MNHSTPPHAPFPRDDHNNDADALDRLLRESASRSAPISDNGFSNRVLAALPSARPRTRALSLRTALCLAGALIGMLFSLKNTHASLPINPADFAEHFTATLLELSRWLTASAQLALLSTLALSAIILLFFDARLRRWL